jgi:2-polyprenyl-6-methoxyphenol hydroxylase-like FAD-dependent oxidoreductase
MAGLLAARALTDFYERVTVVERDEFPAGSAHRRGVPQGRHYHTVLLRGGQVLDSLFPGLVEEFVEAGASTPNLLLDARAILGGYRLATVDTGSLAIQLTRPLLESMVRARLAALPNVKIVDGCEAVGPHFADGRVVGAHVMFLAGGRPELFEADLVVDATGRSGRAVSWLTEQGYPAPTEDRLKIGIAYVTQFLRLNPEITPAEEMILVGPVPGRTNGFIFAAQEGDRWILTVVGMAGEHPPSDGAGLLEFVRRSAPPDVFEVIRAAEPLCEPLVHKYPASRWRRYERLRRFPEGLVVVGDAICSFNPIYGQGMTVAALEAEALQECLKAGDQGLARRFFQAAAKIVDPVWQFNVGGDLALPEIEGARPLRTRLTNRYVARLQRIAQHDPVVANAFIRVIGLLEPPSALTRPGVLARAIVGGRSKGHSRRQEIQ